MPQRGQEDEGRPCPRLPRRLDEGRRFWPGARSRRTRRQPTHHRRALQGQGVPHAAEAEALGLPNRRLRGVGENGCARPAHGRRDAREEGNQHRRGPEALGVSAPAEANSAHREGRRLAAHGPRPFPPREAGSQEPSPLRRRRPRHARPSPLLRPPRPPADARADRRVRARLLTFSLSHSHTCSGQGR